MTQAYRDYPAAVARIAGIDQFPDISGTVSFFDVPGGTLVIANVYGLPSGQSSCSSGVFGFHIHEGESCSGQNLSDTGGHFNPNQCPHPYHAGDLPPLFAFGGRAYLAVLVGRFRTSDVIGRTVVIHSEPDDFRTQPSGDSGEKIACGVIQSSVF